MSFYLNILYFTTHIVFLQHLDSRPLDLCCFPLHLCRSSPVLTLLFRSLTFSILIVSPLLTLLSFLDFSSVIHLTWSPHVTCDTELQAKILSYHRSKSLHAQQVYWPNILLLELREMKAREEQMCQSLWHSAFHQHYHTQFFWEKEPFLLRTWKILRDSRFYAHTVLQDNDLTSHRQRQNNSSSLLSESDRDSGMCDCSSLKSIMQTLEFI